MAKKTFEATEGLLHDVMRKQAGSIEKAVLEAVMNSVDAGADSISLTLEEGRLLISDDGKGMTEGEIDEYFKKFGLKDDDIEEKDFGKFRMGRGQIFNFGVNIWATKENVLVVNLNDDETTLTVQGEERTLDTEGLSYNVLESKEPVEGCTIEVQLYDYIEDIDDQVEEVKSLIKFIPWFHDVDVTINGKEFEPEPEVDVETEYAYYALDADWWGKHSKLYNKGAYVKDETLGPVQAEIITKEDLDLNFARNDVIDGDELWEQVQEDYQQVMQDHLVETGDLTKGQKQWLIERAADDQELLAQIKDKPIVTDVTGEELTLEELTGEQVAFARKGDKVAEDAMKRSGVKMVDKNFAEAIQEFTEEEQVREYEDVVDKELKFEMSEIPISDLSKRRTENLFKTRWFLSQCGHRGEVKAGYSNHAKVWKDGEGTVYIHKDFLNKQRNLFTTKVLDEAMRVAAHDGDTRGGFDEDYTFYRNYWRLAQNASDPRHKLVQGAGDWEVKKKEWELEQARD